MPFFDTPEISNSATSTPSVSSDVKANQTATSVDNTRQGALSAVANADYWQSQKQNLPGFRNVVNGANRGASLGAAHSVMTSKAQHEEGMKGIDKHSQKAASSIQNFANASNAKNQADRLTYDKVVSEAQNKIIEENSKWQGLFTGLNTALAGFQLSQRGSNALNQHWWDLNKGSSTYGPR